MYTPREFVEDRLEVLHQVIEDNNFGILITVDGEHSVATHLPFAINRTRGTHGTLECHMARANPAWQEIGDGKEVLAIFSGPHAYVTPTWYQSAPMVPTWNYVSVHAYGVPVLREDPASKKQLMAALANGHEMRLGTDWRLDDQPESYVSGMLKGIVGFEMPISRIEGKFKMSQNRKEIDRQGVIDGLRATREPTNCSVADIIEDRKSAS